MIRLIVLLCTLFTPLQSARADDALEVISLQHRTVDEVLPSLRPLLEPGGALTGMHTNLILRASSANRAQIKQALAALDTAARQLRISVRQSLDHQHDTRTIEGYGSVDTGRARARLPPSQRGGARMEIGSDRAHAGVRLDNQRRDATSLVSQQVRVSDGGRALIHAGVALPLTLRETFIGPYGRSVRERVVYQHVGSGFYATPRLAGERVTLDIHPVQQAFATSTGMVTEQALYTSVSGRLNEWIALGSSHNDTTQDQRRLAGRTHSDTGDTGQIWLKVEVVDY